MNKIKTVGRYMIEVWKAAGMNMDKVESVNVDQSLLGRLLGYGTVTVHGTGGGIEPLPDIASPIAFRNHVTAA